ncbi:hypothetical protein ABPG74_010048 [Tetrahymena malaccensis]
MNNIQQNKQQKMNRIQDQNLNQTIDSSINQQLLNVEKQSQKNDDISNNGDKNINLYLSQHDSQDKDVEMENFQEAKNQQSRQNTLKMKDNQTLQNENQTLISKIKIWYQNNKIKLKLYIVPTLVIVFLILILMLISYFMLQFIKGYVLLGNGEQVVMNLESCSLMIYDFSLKSQLTLDVNFLSTGINIPSSVDSDKNMFLTYTYPNNRILKRHSTYSYVSQYNNNNHFKFTLVEQVAKSYKNFNTVFSEENGVKTLNFNNKFSSYECEIVLFVYKPTQFQSLNINCGDTNQCNIIIYSTQLSTVSMNIKGINVQMNAPYLAADTFNYLSMKGTIEIPFFVFQTANINTREGDISIQSASDIDLTYTQKDPYNCISSKQITDNTNNILDLQSYQNSIKFQIDTKQCQAVYPWGLPQDQQKYENVIEYRCYSNHVFLKNTGLRTSKLTASNSYGNIFVNVIPAQGSHVEISSQNYQILFNKASKTENQDNNKNIDYINFSNLDQINLLNQTKEASNPNIYDPIFVFDIGPKFTRSATFQQIQFSYNPAYTYMKPYWLGVLTLTMMTTENYSGQYTLSPGFCPYVPELSLEKIQNTQHLISTFMKSNSAPQQSLTTNAWQSNVDYPNSKFGYDKNFYGFRDINLNRNDYEKWIGVNLDQSKIYNVKNYDYSNNRYLFAAIVVSGILSLFLGSVLLFTLVFVIYKNYTFALNNTQIIHKYAQLQKSLAGEIDESTLDIHKRRFYHKYKEEQSIINEQNKKSEQKNEENLANQEQGSISLFNTKIICNLFKQFIFAPPHLSALIDYSVLVLLKSQQNSIEQFYKLLFRSKKLKELKEDEDEEIHSLEKDQLQGNEMKQLYEQFCYLNQYLERKFDDEENLKFLQDMGFKIVARLNAQTQYFAYIKYNGIVTSISEQPNKTSIDLFISSCCNLTKFDTDRIESSELESYYIEFCTINHMQKLQLNEGSLMRDYGISTIYLPQQWVERDERYDIEMKQVKYFIDKKRVQNYFKILLAKDSTLLKVLFDTEEFKQAQEDMQQATRTWQSDILTTLFHAFALGFIGFSFTILAIFIRVLQSPYSLISPMRLIYLDTITYYPTSIPVKLMGDNWIVQGIAIITLIFWIFSFCDLIYYYVRMDFPKELYFNKHKLGKVAIWLMLSAIINPNAFLPYATSAATFVTLVTKKYREFKEISQNGFKIISDYIQKIASHQFQELFKKMDIQDNLANLVPVDTLRDITAEASKLGIIDPSTSENLQNNLEIMIRDPSIATKLGQDFIKISQDPHAFAQQMAQKLEEKAKALIQQQVEKKNLIYKISKLIFSIIQVSTIDKDISNELVNLIWCLLKNQKEELKSTINSFVNALVNTFQKKQGKQSIKSIGFINLKGPVFDFIWEFAFPVENFKGNYQDHLINIFCVALANIINVWNKDLKNILVNIPNDNIKEKVDNENYKSQSEKKDELFLLKEKLMKDQEKAESILQADDGLEEELEAEITSEEAIINANKNIIFSAIQICRSIQSSNGEVILNQILNLMQNGSKLPGFEILNQVKKYQDIFKIGYAIFKNDKKIDFEDINKAFKCFVKNTGLEDKIKEIVNIEEEKIDDYDDNNNNNDVYDYNNNNEDQDDDDDDNKDHYDYYNDDYYNDNYDYDDDDNYNFSVEDTQELNSSYNNQNNQMLFQGNEKNFNQSFELEIDHLKTNQQLENKKREIEKQLKIKNDIIKFVQKCIERIKEIADYEDISVKIDFEYNFKKQGYKPTLSQDEKIFQKIQEDFIELNEFTTEFQNQLQEYEKKTNEIQKNIKEQDNIDYQLKQIKDKKKWLANAQAQIEEYKACQMAFNKIQQDRIVLHKQMKDNKDKISYYKKYIDSLVTQLKKLEQSEIKKNYETDNNFENDRELKSSNYAQQKEDKDNLLSSAITVMLNLFNGSIANLSTDLIKDLSAFFKLVSQNEQVQNKDMFVFLHKYIQDQAQNQKGKQQKKESNMINKFQSILSLVDILLNDSKIEASKIIQNGKEHHLESYVAQSLQIFFLSKFEGFVKQKDIDKYLKGSDLLTLISKAMKLKENIILGFMEILLGYKTSKDIYSFVSFAASLNKIKENNVNAFIHLFNLYSSKNPSELFDALTFFSVADNDEKYSVKELVLVILYLREQLHYRDVQEIISKMLQIQIKNDDTKLEKNKQQIKEKIKEKIKFKQLPSYLEKILQIEIKGYLQANSLYKDFKGFNRNFDVLLEQADFNFLKKLLQIRNIPRIEDPTQNTIVKNCITDISDMLNIDYQSVELFINLLTSSKSNKLKQALDILQILKINPKSNQNNINSFVDFTSSILEKIEQKNQNITNISKNIFSDNLPNCLLRKILYHEGIPITYADCLELFNIYSNKNIPKSIKNLLDFRYGMTGNRKRDIYKFLYPFQKEEIDKDYKNFKKSKSEQQGLIKAVQILSINEQSLRIQTFLQYLIKNKQNALLMTSCLLVYFSGCSSNIILHFQSRNEKKQKKVNVEQLLCILLEVKQEFFEAINSYFHENMNYYTYNMIKFYRQLDYLQQKANGLENKIFQNNITVSDKSVEQYLRMMNHLEYNTSFISKDTKISIEAVELVSNLMYIKNSKTEQERNQIFEQMKNNTYISKLFSQLGINHQDFVTLVKIMYLDYQPTNVKWLSKCLKLPTQFKIDGLQQLLMLDQILPVYGESSQNKKLLINLIKTNKFVKSFKIDTTWAEVAYILCKGDFCLLSKYQDKLIPLKYPSFVRFERFISNSENHKLEHVLYLTQAVNANDIKYMSLVQGLAGLLSCRNSIFQTTEFLQQLYTYINQKYVKNEQMDIENGLKKGNTLQYAIYKFTKSTQISPVWTLLMMGDLNTWEFLAQNYYLVNNCKNPYLNPILALVYVLNFRSNPLIVKQLLVNLEYDQRSYQIQIAKFKKDNYKRAEKEEDPNYVEQYQDSDEEIKEQISEDIKKKTKNQKQPNKDQEIKLTKEQQEKLQQLEQQIIKCKTQINELLKNSLEEEGENLFAIAEEINFPQKVIKMVLIYDYDNEQKKKNQNGKKQFDLEDEEDEDNDRLTYEQIRKAFEPLKQDLQNNKNITEQILEFEILNGVFEQIATCFYTDPRKEKMNLSNEEKLFTNSYCLHTYSSSPLMQMIVLSTIAQLKLSYYYFYGFTERDEDHLKQVTFAIDLILGTLEKYFYFDDMMDFFPRHRLIPLIGLSVGLVIETDDILQSITSQSIFGKQYNKDVIEQLCSEIFDELKNDKYKKNEDQQKYIKDYIQQKKFDMKYHYDELMQDNYHTEEMFYHMADPKSFYTYYRRNQCIDRNAYKEIDIYSGESNKKLFKYLDGYGEVAESENFKLLIDIFKQNFKSLNNQENFSQDYGQDKNMYFGTLMLNGIIYQDKDIKFEDFQQSILLASLYMTSNKKALAEILSLLINSLQNSFSLINELLNDSEENLLSFVNLAMDKSFNQPKDLEIVLSKSLLSDTNKEVVKNCVWAYQGKMTEYLKLIQHSPLFQQSQESITLLTEFLYSFEKSQMHKNKNNPNEINYFNFSNLSPNREKALKKAQKYLWQICQSFYKSQDDKKMFQLIQNILQNDWNFLISEQKYSNSFKQLFGKMNDLDYQKLKILALIKPQKLGLKIQDGNLNYFIKFTKVYNMITEGDHLFERSTQEIQQKQSNYSKIQYNQNNLHKQNEENNFIEAKYLHLLLSLSNNSLVHTLNCLNTTQEEWIFQLKEEQKRLQIPNSSNNNNNKQIKSTNDVQYSAKQNQNHQKVQKTIKEISYTLQSIYLWKNISHVNWSSVEKNLDMLIKQPQQNDIFKNQIDFLQNCILYLSILPAIILDNNDDGNKSEKVDEKYIAKILKLIKIRNLDIDIFTRHIIYERNSIFMINKSYQKLIKYFNQDFYYQQNKEQIDQGENNYTKKLFKKFANCENVYYLLNFLNGNFLKEIENVHPLIKYLSNLYFKGLEAIHTQNPEPITKYLNDCIDNKDSFINIILKENDQYYAKIFNKILDIIFTISFFTIKNSKIRMEQKKDLVNKVQQLLVDVAKDLLQTSDEIVNIVYAVFYIITDQNMQNMENTVKYKQSCLIMLLKMAFENPNLSEFFFRQPKTGDSKEQIDKMINTITSILQSILDRPFQSINDSNLVKEVLKLMKYSSKGNIDLSIIEDVIAILTGDHQRVFNLLKKFEIVDENKIALIQRTFNQVADMPIFKQQHKAIADSRAKGYPDKIKEILKKHQEGKVVIADVFLAVDAEGDNNGAVSIDEFQSFVRRLGMELSRHRVYEIFASIKNQKLKPTNLEKTDDLVLNAEEFEIAFKYVNDKKTYMSLEKLGISPTLLALALGFLILILILLFVFIFLGIKAFTIGGTFGSIINSIIPIVAAGSATAYQENKKDKLEEKQFSKAVSETLSIIHSENI